MKVIIPMWVAQFRLRPAAEPSYCLFSNKITSDAQWALVYEDPIPFEVEIPDDFDPRQAQVAALDEKVKQLRAEHMAELVALMRTRAELLAIEAPTSNAADQGAGLQESDSPF